MQGRPCSYSLPGVIERAVLHNFKAFADLELELRPLTFLFGPNNTGKSSILALFRLLAQTIDAADPRVALLLDGPLGDFGTFKDVVHGNQASREMSIKLTGLTERRFERPPLSTAMRAGVLLDMPASICPAAVRRPCRVGVTRSGTPYPHDFPL